MILRHFYHQGLLPLSSSCYYTASVESANEFGSITVSVAHPGGLDEIDSDRADAGPLTSGMEAGSKSRRFCPDSPRRKVKICPDYTGDKGPNTHRVHGENIEIAVNM